MKYLKSYESFEDYKEEDELEIGTYVICNLSKLSTFYNNIEFRYFIENSIGKITNILSEYVTQYNYIIKYNNIPENLQKYFHESSKKSSKNPHGLPKNSRGFFKDDIKYFGTKENLKTILISNKYNI